MGSPLDQKNYTVNNDKNLVLLSMPKTLNRRYNGLTN